MIKVLYVFVRQVAEVLRQPEVGIGFNTLPSAALLCVSQPLESGGRCGGREAARDRSMKQPVTLHLSLDSEGTEAWYSTCFLFDNSGLDFCSWKVPSVFRACLLCSSFLVTSSRHAHRYMSTMILNPLNLIVKISHYTDHSIMNLFCLCI